MPKKSVHSSIPKELFLEWARLLDNATRYHYINLATGKELDRHRRIEILCKSYSDSKELRQFRIPHNDYFKGDLAYITPRRRNLDNLNIIHGLGVSEGMVRFILSAKDATIIPERKFHGPARPDFGIVINDKILLYEFCTEDNARRLNVLKHKINSYSNLDKTYVVLFVMMISRDEVKEKIQKLKPEGSFLFCDLRTFMSVPLGDQLRAKIYLWEDGNEYALRPD